MVKVGNDEMTAEELEKKCKKLEKALDKKIKKVAKNENELSKKLNDIKTAQSAPSTSQEKNYYCPTEDEWKNIFARIEQLEEECKMVQTLIKGEIEKEKQKLYEDITAQQEKTYSSKKEDKEIKEQGKVLEEQYIGLENREKKAKATLAHVATIIKKLMPESNFNTPDEKDFEQLDNALSKLKEYFFTSASTIDNIVLRQNIPVTKTHIVNDKEMVEANSNFYPKAVLLIDTIFAQLREKTRFPTKRTAG